MLFAILYMTLGHSYIPSWSVEIGRKEGRFHLNMIIHIVFAIFLHHSCEVGNVENERDKGSILIV